MCNSNPEFQAKHRKKLYQMYLLTRPKVIAEQVNRRHRLCLAQISSSDRLYRLHNCSTGPESKAKLDTYFSGQVVGI